MRTLLSRRARTRAPSGRIGLFLEVRARPERRDEISRIDELSRHDQQRIAVWQIEPVEVLGHYCVSAVGHAVFPKIAGLHVRRDDSQRTAARDSAREESTACHRAVPTIPGCD